MVSENMYNVQSIEREWTESCDFINDMNYEAKFNEEQWTKRFLFSFSANAATETDIPFVKKKQKLWLFIHRLPGNIGNDCEL